MEQYTWQQFLVATISLTLVWYIVVILLYYRKELKSFLNGKPKNETPEPLPHKWDKSVDELEQEAEDFLTGKSKLPDGMSKVSIEEIRFVDDDAKEDKLGLVSDVLEEIKTVFSILVKEDGNKAEFLKLMQGVKDNYPGIISNPNLNYINEFITDHASFHLSADELENLWY